MEIPFERWYKAIPIRRSRRQFDGRKLDDGDSSRLYSVCKDFRPFEGSKAVFCDQSPEDVFKGAAGKYGKIKGAPFFVAFIGRTDDPHINEKTGYTGEGIILEATAMGLATCWVAGFYRPEIAGQFADIAPNERVLGVSPVGYAVEKWTFEEKVMSGFGRSHRRKPISELIIGSLDDALLKQFEPLLESARLAPSAVNRQPWRFYLSKDGITISSDDIRDTFNISKRLDCGIAMLHIEVACIKAGLEGRWEFLKPPDVAKYCFKTIQ